MAEERLQKIMARAGLGSRRACEEMIRQKRVTVNGNIATLGMSADPQRDEIRVDGARLPAAEPPVYVMVNKPRYVISDEDVSGEHPTVRQLVPLGGYLYVVGRLDLESEGLVLLTNDGDLAHKLTHPRYEHPKTYRVLVEGTPSETTLATWERGIMLDGEKTAPVTVTRLGKEKGGVWLQVVMREGRKRQIRRVAAMLGHPVRQVIRTELGPLKLGGLGLGAWRRLTEEEVQALGRVRRSRPRSRPQAVRTPPQTRRRQPRADRRSRPPERRKPRTKGGR